MMKRMIAVCLGVVLISSGCATNKKWGEGTTKGALIGAVIGGGGGAGVQAARGETDASDMGTGAAIGVAVGALLGGLVGHYVWDEEETATSTRAGRADTAEAAAEPAPAEPAPAPAPAATTEVAVVYFGVNSATLPPAEEKALEQSLDVLRSSMNPIVITGHTDASGNPEYNLELGRRRATAVRDYLVEHQVPAERISVESKGQSDPVAPNDTAAGRAKNRRAVVVRLGAGT